jgi:methionyl-tRNA formyltransferase
MDKCKIKIVYMGTPGFAVEPLKQLILAGYDIKAIVTVPDKPAGRGCKITESEVKKFATEQGLKILQPEKLKSPDFHNELKETGANLFIVVAFRMLPKEVWQMPELGTFNLHASLLPDYRGAAPINHAVINGETKSGVTTFFINEDIDTGNIIFQEECEILPEDNAGSLHDKLMTIGANLVVKTVDSIAEGNIKTIPQETISNRKLNPAPKITKEYCRIDFNDNAETIHNKIRGLSPYPGAWATIPNSDDTFKVFESSFETEPHDLPTGTFVSDNKSYLKVAAKDGFVFIQDLQIAGKKRMKVRDLLNGYRFG